MKIRHGFVSNSSSSSYTCDSCGATHSGWDLCISEAGMAECVNGHVFCESHTSFKFDDYDRTIDEKKKFLLNDPDMKDKIQDISDEAIEDLFGEWIGEVRSSMPASICPFCSLEDVTDKELISYWLKSTGITRQQVMKQIRSRCPTYEKFCSFLKS